MVRLTVSFRSGVEPSAYSRQTPHWSSMLMIPVSPHLVSHLQAEYYTMGLMIPRLTLQGSRVVLNGTRCLMRVPVHSVVAPTSIRCVSTVTWDTIPVLSVD